MRERGGAVSLPAMDDQAKPLLTLKSRRADATKVGRLMSAPIGVFPPETTVGAAIKALRELTREAIVTYCYVADAGGKLLGVVVMREMLLAPRTAKLESLMIRDPFAFREDMKLEDALKAAIVRHYPVYPVCDGEGRLAGLVRGEELFAEQAIEISAQSGQMVGVDKEERFATPSCAASGFAIPGFRSICSPPFSRRPWSASSKTRSISSSSSPSSCR